MLDARRLLVQLLRRHRRILLSRESAHPAVAALFHPDARAAFGAPRIRRPPTQLWRYPAVGSAVRNLQGCDGIRATLRLSGRRGGETGGDARVSRRLLRGRGGQFKRPRRDDLVLFQHRAAHAIAVVVFLLQAFEAVIAPGRARVERKDRIAGEHEASAQRAEHRIAGGPMRRTRAGTHRLDLVAVVLQRRPRAAHAQHALEAPDFLAVLHAGLARDRRRLPARVAVLALGFPGAGPEEEGVVYPCTCTESFGACARSSIV